MAEAAISGGTAVGIRVGDDAHAARIRITMKQGIARRVLNLISDTVTHTPRSGP